MLREWELHLTTAYLVPPLILAAQLGELCNWGSDSLLAPRLSQLIQTFGVFWPLALCLGLATLLPYERQEGMLELRLSYPRPYWLSLLQKIALPIS